MAGRARGTTGTGGYIRHGIADGGVRTATRAVTPHPAARRARRAAAAGTIAVPLALKRDEPPRTDEDSDRRQPLRNYPAAAREFPFNTGWVFGEYTAGSEQPGYDETHLTGVTLPHCVTRLSWQKWDPSAWQRVWIYRRTFDGTGLLNGRVLADFDGVMVNATVLINGETVTTHMGGYLPFSAELTGYLQPRRQRAGGDRRRPLRPGPAAGRPGTTRRPSTSCSPPGSTAMSGCGSCRALTWPMCSPSRSTC